MIDNNTNKGFSSAMITNILLSVVVFFLLINTCTNMSVSKKVNNLPDIIYIHDSILVEQFKTMSVQYNIKLEKKIKEDIDLSLYNFLIYEDDLDRGKTSLSQIKTIITENNREINEDNTE